MRSFVITADAIAATTKKLEKLRLISEFLKSLNISDAVVAARFLSAYPFASHDQRTLGVGGANLSRVIAEAAGNANQTVGASYRNMEIWAIWPRNFSHSISEATCRSRRSPACSKNWLPRAATPRKPNCSSGFRAASAGDIKYIVKIITGDLRIGSKESLVEQAIAKAYNQALSGVRRANMMTGDIGKTLTLAAQNQLSRAVVRLFHPLGFMLAAPG